MPLTFMDASIGVAPPSGARDDAADDAVPVGSGAVVVACVPRCEGTPRGFDKTAGGDGEDDEIDEDEEMEREREAATARDADAADDEAPDDAADDAAEDAADDAADDVRLEPADERVGEVPASGRLREERMR